MHPVTAPGAPARTPLRPLLLLLLLIAVPGQARAGVLRGAVVDSSGAPLGGASVIVEQQRLGTVTRPSGGFELRNVAAGRVHLRVSHLGYRPSRVGPLRLEAGDTLRLQPVVLASQSLRGVDVVYTAHRARRAVAEVAVPVNLVPARELRLRDPLNPAEALREEPGLAVQKTGHGGGSAMIRGLSANQILLLVDNVRVNNTTYRLGNHPYLTLTPRGLLERIEVVRGPTSVLFGSDALGGAVNLITEDPSFAPDTAGLVVGGEVASRAATADRSLLLRAESEVSRARTALRVGAGVTSTGDLRRGGWSPDPGLERSTDGRIQRPTAYDRRDLDAKWRIHMGRNRDLTLAMMHTRREEVPRYDKYEAGDAHLWLYDPQQRDLAYARYRSRDGVGALGDLEATLSWQRHIEGRTVQSRQGAPVVRERDEVTTRGAAFSVELPAGRHRLLLGGEAYLDRVASSRELRDTTGALLASERGRYPDGAEDLHGGLYAQGELNLGRGWRAVAGGRLSRHSVTFELDDPVAGPAVQQEFRSFTGSGGVVKALSPAVALRARVGQAFRAPNVADMGRLGESKGDTWEVPSPDLEPERALSFDLGAHARTPALEADLALFVAEVEELIDSAPDTWQGSDSIQVQGRRFAVRSKQNIGSARFTGVEARARMQGASPWFGRILLTWVRGENLTTGEPVRAPAPQGLAGMGWSRGGTLLEAYLRAAAGQERLAPDDREDPRIPEGGTPGWWTLNLRASWRPLEWATVRLGVENLLDRNYREHGSGVNGPGRNLVAGLTLRY